MLFRSLDGIQQEMTASGADLGESEEVPAEAAAVEEATQEAASA